MKTLNKSLLAAATVSAFALSGIASAATMEYPANQQFTHARDMAAQASNIFTLSNEFTVKASNSSENARLLEAYFSGTNGGSTLQVRVTLTGAEFSNTYANATALASLFMEGTQVGAATATPVSGVSNASFPGAGREELLFDFVTTADGDPAGDYILRLPDALELASVNNSLGVGNDVVITVAIQAIATPATVAGDTYPGHALNDGVGPILADTATLVRSLWGLRLTQDNVLHQPPGDLIKRIDVGSQPIRYTRYATTTSGIGGSNPPPGPAGSLYYNAGGFQLDVTEIATLTPVKIYGEKAPTVYSVNTGAHYVVQVSGDNLSPWAPAGQRIWLTNTVTCPAPANTTHVLTVNTTTNVATSGNISALDALFGDITNTPTPGATGPTYVCFSADSTTSLVPQTALNGTVQPVYNLPAQRRVDVPSLPFQLVPLQMNGTVLTFQNVNPGGNTNAQSFLRLSNHNPDGCPVVIDAKDDRGRLSQPVSVTLAAHASEQFQIDALEAGKDNQTSRPARFITGLGKSPDAGVGAKWYVRVLFECNNVSGTAWNRNLSTLSVTTLNQENGSGAQWSADTSNMITWP